MKPNHSFLLMSSPLPFPLKENQARKIELVSFGYRVVRGGEEVKERRMKTGQEDGVLAEILIHFYRRFALGITIFLPLLFRLSFSTRGCTK